MPRNSVIASVSISKEQDEFACAHKLSLSDLLQTAITEQILIFERYSSDIKKLELAIKAKDGLQSELFKFLELNDLTEKFLKWRGENVLEQA